MARPILKLTKSPVATIAKAPSSRAVRAHLQATRNAPRTATPVTVAAPAGNAPDVAAASSPRAGESPVAPRAKTRRRTAARPPATADQGPPKGKPNERRPRTDRGKRSAPASGVRPAPPVAATPVAAVRRADTPDLPRLSKRMSELGLCSRREADDWIERGWVTVDGDVVTTLGTRVAPTARIEVSKAATRHQDEQVTILLNKPIGYVSGQAEDGHRPASVLLVPENRWESDPSRTTFKPGHLRGLAPAGRLDIDSTGLLVFTQDGRVAKRLIGSDSEVEKEYLVRVEGTLDEAGLRRLRHGLELDGVQLKPAKVSWQNEHQLRFVLREGRKRQIRRMCELVGLAVTGLKRVRSGSVALGPLPMGKWRYLRADETF